MADDDRILTSKEAAEYLRVSLTNLYRWRTEGTGPRSIKMGRQTMYRLSDIQAWIKANEQ